ncbi:MAG: phage holin family protein [Candidatus Cloacimonetes bacterium]|nr:phage holin family protein [Candidatus Cloacimonadota bacterium]
MNFIAKWIILSISIFLVSKTRLLHIDGGINAVLAALFLSLINIVVRPILVFLTLPLTVITFGIFLLFINGLMLMLVSWLVPGVVVGGWLNATLTSLIITVIASLLNGIFRR